MTNRYSTIFFDWSGVIADDSGDEFVQQLFRGIGATDNQIKEIIETFFIEFMSGTVSEAEFWEKIKINYRLNVSDLALQEVKKWRGLIANTDILELAGNLRAQGFQIAVLTNIIKPVYNIIKQAGYYDLFDEVIASCEVGFVKPQREIYELALDRSGVTAQQSIFIDDKQLNIDAANILGFKTILAQSPNQIIRDLKKLV